VPDIGSLVGPALLTAGPWGLLIALVAVVVTAFVKGALVAGSTVAATEARYQAEQARLVALWEARLTESGQRERDWRDAYQRAEQRGDVMAEQLDQLLTYAQTTERVLRALPMAGGGQ
jgi:K+-sensing histidine kinase KdpD